MKLSKTVILILLLILILGAIIFLQFFNKSGIDKNNPKITPSNQPSQFSPSNNLLKISINNININDDVILVGQPVIIDFSAPISIDSLKIEVSPEEELKLRLDDSSTKLIIETVSGIWKYNSSYNLSISGQILNKSYNYTFKTRPYSGI